MEINAGKLTLIAEALTNEATRHDALGLQSIEKNAIYHFTRAESCRSLSQEITTFLYHEQPIGKSGKFEITYHPNN